MCALEDLRAALRGAWSIDTCDAAAVGDWSPANPALGQCGVTALVVHDHCGGDLLVAEVLNPDGTRQGWHYWNRLPDGAEIDFTREQFTPREAVQEPRIVTRPAGLPRRSAEQYLRLSARVERALGGAVGDEG